MSDVYVGGVKTALAMDTKPWVQSISEGLKSLDSFYKNAAALFQKTDKAGAGMGDGLKKTFSGDLGMGKFGTQVQNFGARMQTTFQQVVTTSQTLSARFKQAFAPETAAPLNQTGEQVKKFQVTFSQAAKQYAADCKAFSDSSKEWSKQVTGMGKVLAGGGATITAGLALAGKRYLDFNKAMRNTNSIAKESEPAFEQTSEAVRKLAVELRTGQSVQSFATALYDINSSGYQGADGLKMLRISAIGAKAGLTDIQTVSEGLGQALNSYGVSVKSAEHFQDVFFNTVDKGVISAEQLYSNIGSVTSLAASAKVPIEELGAAIAVMTQRGAKPAVAMTGLRQLIYKLSSPGKEARDMLRGLGYQMGEAELQTKGLSKVLQGLFKATGGRTELLSPILGSDEAVSAAKQLMGMDNGALLQERTQENLKGTGSTVRAFAQQMKADMQSLDEIATNVEAFSLNVGQGFVRMFAPAVVVGRDFTRMLALMSPEAQKNVGSIGAVTGGVLTMSGALLLAAPNLAALPAGLKVLGSGINLVLTPIRALVAGMGAIPFALVLAGTAALATAWQRDWGGIREIAGQAISYIGERISDLSSWFRANLGDWNDWKALASAAMGAVGRVYKSEISPLFEAFASEWQRAQPYMRMFGAVVKATWDVTYTAMRIGTDLTIKALELLGRFLAQAVGIWSKLVHGDWKGACEQFVEAFRAIIPRLMQAARELGDQLMNELAGLPGRLVESGKAAARAFIDGWRGEQPAITGPELFRGFGGPSGGGAVSKMMQQAQKQVLPWVAKIAKAGSTGLAKWGQAVAATPVAKDNVPSRDELDEMIKASKHHAAASKKKVPLTRGQMLSYIGRNSSVSADANLNGLDNETLSATYRLVENAVNNKVKLAITSAFRSTSNTNHGAGKAIDLAALGVPRNLAPETIKMLAQGTGFRSGINEYDPAARAWTGGSGDHMHLTTGQERLGNTGVFALDGKIRQGAKDVMLDMEKYKESLQEWGRTMKVFADKPVSEFDKRREQIQSESIKLQKDARALGLPKEALDKVREAEAQRMQQVAKDEKAAVGRTLAEITLMRLEAEGKAGEAARARIAQSADEEKRKLDEQLKLFPQLRAEAEAARAAIDGAAGRQVAGLNMQDASTALGDRNAIADFQRQDAGINALMGQFPQFQTQIQAAYSAIQAYIQNPAEATRALFEQAKGYLTDLGSTAEGQQQRKLQAIEYERALGQLTRDEALARQADVLNNWVGGEESKKAMMLQMVDAYRENFETQLEMQGEFNATTLQDFVDSLTQMQTLTLAQQAQLAAANQLILQQRMADQQTWMGMLQQGLGSFQSFLTGVMSGQQSFSQGFTQLWKGIANQVIGEIIKMIIKATILQKILSSIFGFFGGILGLGGGAVASSSSGFVGPMLEATSGFIGPSVHTGGLIGAGGAVRSFHTGGMVGWGAGLGMSLRGDEMMAKLQTGEYVMSREQVQNLNRSPLPSGGGSISVGDIHLGGVHMQKSDESPEQLGLRMGRGIVSAIQGMAY